MSPSNRAGDTVDDAVDHQQEVAGPGGGNGHAGNGSAGSGAAPGDDEPVTKSRPKRRSVVSSGAAPAPERGSTSARGASSSSITKRSITGSASFPEDTDDAADVPDAAPAEVLPAAVPLTAAPLAVPPTPTHTPAPSGRAAEPDEPAPRTLTEADVPTDVVISSRRQAGGSAPSSTPPTARVDPHARRPSSDRAIVATPLPVTLPAGPPAERGAPLSTTYDTGSVPPDAPYVTTTMSSHQVAPVPRVLGRRPRVRRVTRVVRHVDPWSVFKIAIVFNLVLYAVLLTAGVLLWNVAYATGTVDNLERFFESFGWSDFQFDGGAIYHATWISGLFGVIGLTGAVVLAATLFNLITDLVGGVRMTVLEEEVVEKTMAPMRRFVVRRPTGTGGDPSAGLRAESDRLPDVHGPNDDPSR